jgi:predicted outer membrane repeat protein
VDANNNQTTGDGGVINITDGSVSVDGSDFTNNTAGGSGGAINADGGSLVVSGGSFDGNSATDGGAISSGSGSADLSVSNGASFTDNTATDNGGAIYNDGTLNLVSNDGNDIVFSSNSAGTSGDDIYNASDTSVININGNGGKVVIGGGDDDKGGIGGTGQINKSGDGTLELGAGSDSSDFTGSFAQSGGTSVIGGGILVWDGADASKDSGATLIITDNGNLAVINGGTLDLNNAGDSIAGGAAIFVDGGSTLELSNSGATATINGNDVILGNLEMSDGNIIFDGAPGALANYDQTGGTATITGGADLTLSPSVVISGGNIVIDGGTLNTGGQIINLAAGGNGDGSLTLSNGGRLNAIDGITNDNNFAGSLTVSGNNYIGIDLNAATGQSDQFIFAGAAQGAPSGTLILDDINFVGKAPTQEQIVFTVVSAGSYDNSLSFAAAEKSFMSPILEYRLDSLGDGKYALDKSGYNPTIFRGAAASVSAFNTQLMTMDAVYAHIYQDSMEHRSDGYMGWQQREERGTVWAKGYGMAGNIDAGQGADMKSAAYGIVAGLDLAPWRHANYGTRFMPSLYMALSGASADYSGASISQSSLQLGAVGTLTYGNLQLSALGYAGKIYNSMQVMGADDKTDGWIYGASAEVAYFANLGGGWELAPNVRAVYGSISAQNWHSDYGDIDISAKQLNGLAIAPGINVMYALSGWNLFAGGQYVKNFGVSAAGMAESISLPKIKLPDFAELSFGGNVRLGQSWLLDAKVAVRAGDGVSGFGGQLGATWRF